MNSPDDPGRRSRGSGSESPGSSIKRIRIEDVLADFRSGLRTKYFLTKYDLSLNQFEQLLKQLIRDGLFTKEQFRAWKAHRSIDEVAPDGGAHGEVDPLRPDPHPSSVSTYIITDPETNGAWALELFSTSRDEIRGAKFKVNLQGKRYSFVVEDMLFRGSVKMRADQMPSTAEMQNKREEALKFIGEHGWAAYLENRAFAANFGDEEPDSRQKARLVLLHCRNQTFLAALHTPTPAINLYVASSLDKIRRRLSKSVDTTGINI